MDSANLLVGAPSIVEGPAFLALQKDSEHNRNGANPVAEFPEVIQPRIPYEGVRLPN